MFFDILSYDMQLCDFSLSEYIEFHKGQRDLTFAHDTSSSHHVLITKDSPPLAIATNVCEIACHIALGLEYTHANGLVHRALQPDHGTSSCEKLIVSSLLSSR